MAFIQETPTNNMTLGGMALDPQQSQDIQKMMLLSQMGISNSQIAPMLISTLFPQPEPVNPFEQMLTAMYGGQGGMGGGMGQQPPMPKDPYADLSIETESTPGKQTAGDLGGIGKQFRGIGEVAGMLPSMYGSTREYMNQGMNPWNAVNKSAQDIGNDPYSVIGQGAQNLAGIGRTFGLPI